LAAKVLTSGVWREEQQQTSFAVFMTMQHQFHNHYTQHTTILRNTRNINKEETQSHTYKPTKYMEGRGFDSR
jgi:hypothetical protein